MKLPRAGQAVVAVIIALGFSVTIVLLAIPEVQGHGHVSSDEATLLATVLGAAIGAVATYLGTRATPNDDDSGPSDPPV